MFRRRSSDAAAVLDQDQAEVQTVPDSQPRPRASVTPPKGVPTPKRSEAQANRRQPYQAPADRKTASQQSRSERVRRSEALQRGEQWALPRKDQGPVRALARDVVDSRRGIGEYYMILIVVLLVMLFVLKINTVIADVIVLAVVVVLVSEGTYVARKVKNLAAERYPGESTQGLTGYVIMRGISMRRMRIPKPRVSPGDKI